MGEDAVDRRGGTTPGVPLAGALIEDEPTGPGVTVGPAEQAATTAPARIAMATTARPGADFTKGPRPSRCSPA